MSTRIRDLLRPLTPSVCATQSLGVAKQVLTRARSEHIVIRDLRDHPIAVITREDIRAFKAALPVDWTRRRCAQAVVSMPDVLSPDDPPEACVQYYRENGIRPVVIFDREEPVGLLHPSEVFQWCALRNEAAVEELAHRARSPHPRIPGSVPVTGFG